MKDTYGRRETIRIEVTASEAVEVIGDPVFRFTIGTELVRAAYDRMTSTATSLVFTYTVQAGDMDGDGIEIGDGSTTFDLDSNDRIRTVAQRIDIDSSHTAPGTLTGHRVDGSRSADDRDPELVAQPDGAKVFTDQLTLTYDEALDGGSVPAAGAYEVTATNGGVTTPLPVSAVAVDGLTVTLTLATPAVFGQVVTLTYTVPGSNPLQDPFGNPAGELTNHPVTNETIVLPVVSIAAVHPKAAPLLADAVFRLTASPAPASDLAVTLSIAQAGAYLASTEQTVTIPAGATSATGTFPIADDYTLASGGLTATVTGGGRLYVPAAAAANAATVQVVVVDPPIVAQWAEDAYEVDEGQDRIATLTLKTAAGMPKPRADYKVRMFTTNHTAVAGDDYTAVSGTPPLTVVPGDWTADGTVFAASVPATVGTVGDSLLEGDERFRLQVSAVTGQAPLGLECPAGLRDLGGAGRCATEIVIDDDETLSVTGVTVTSTPAAGTTYLGGETIEFTATFTAPVTVTGTPTFTFTLGEETREADYASGSGTAELVFVYTVQAGETDTDGISWKANALALDGGTVRLTTTDADVEEDAALAHPAQREGLGEHRVDAVPPGLVLPVTMQATTLRLLYDEALDPASRPAASAYTLAPGGNPSMVAIAGSTVTLTFATAPAEGATVTLAYTAPALNPVKDAAGNPAPAFTGLTVVRGPVVMDVNVESTPTPNLAMSYGYTKAQLSSNVLGLRGYKLDEMTAHGEDATLTFKVLFDRVVTVTGAPTLKLDLWGETRSARYVGGSGTNTLTFTWGPVLTGDNDFDGIEVKALVLAGASIVDAGNAESMFVAESFGGEHFPQHKVFGGFHEMWIDVDPEAEAVEGERFTFSVRRSIGESRDPESHYVLLGITDSAFPGVSASGRYEEAENGPGGRAVTFDQMASEGRRANTEESSLLVIPPVHEDKAGGRTMTIALLTTHLTVRNEHGELAHRIYMPRNLEGVTVPVRVSVSERRAATVTPAVTSIPRLKSIATAPTKDTYGRREIIKIAVTASEAVEVIGDPVFRFTIGTELVRAAYDRGSSATRLVFTYTVQAGDMDGDGIEIGDGTTTFELDSNDRIRTVAHRIDIDRSHTAPGTLTGHKVDGSRSADSTAPALVAVPDGATVFTDELTLTYDEALDAGSVPAAGAYEVTATNGGVTTPLPVSAVAVDGTTVTLTLATPAVFGETVTLTYTVPAANPLRDRFGNPAGALTNHPVTNETTVLPVVSIEAVHAKAAPGLGDAEFRLTASPAPESVLAVTLSIAPDDVYLSGTTRTVTIAAGQTSATGTFPIADDYTLASGGLAATVTGGGRLYVPAPAPANAATVQVVVVNPPIVAQWAKDEYEVAEGQDRIATLTLKTAADVPKPRAAYAVKVFTTNDSAVAADDFTAVDVELTVQPGDWTLDGAVFAASVPATVETVGDSLLEGDERFRLQVSAVTGQAPLGLECPAGLRDLGGTGRCATVITIDDDETLSVTGVTVTSTPAAGTTYLGGETIAFTATFTAPVTVTGTPTFAFMLGEATREATYSSGSDRAELVFSYEVQAGEIDTDGISWSANALALDGGTVRLTTTVPNVEEDAALGHPAQREGLAGHRVDADPPGVESASLDGTRLELVYDEALDEGSVPAAGAYEVTATNGGVTTPLPVSAVAVDGTTVTLTLATPAVFGETVTLTYTVLATNPLRDLFGNPAGALTNHPVTNETTVLVVLPVVSIAAVHAKAAPLLADAVFRLTASAAPASDLAVTLSIAPDDVYLSGTTRTVTIAAGQTSATGTFPIADDYTLASGGLAATVTGGGRLYVPAPAPANAATVQVVVVNPPIVAQWAKDEYEVAEGQDRIATLTLKTAADVPKPRAAYAVKVFTTNDSAVAADDYTAVDVELTVQPGDWTLDGAVFAASVPATVETVGDSLLEGDERFRLQVSAVTGQAPLGLECPAGLRDLGGTGRCATVITIDDDETLSVTGVTVTSTPAAGTTYLGGETIAFTATFTAPVTVTGAPTFAFMLGEETREAAYASGSETLALVFAYTVQAGETDTDGISWKANALALDGGTVRLTTTDADVEEDAALAHPAQREGLGEHRVDADPPGVESASLDGTRLELVYDEVLDGSSEPGTGAYTVAATVGSNPTVSMVSVEGSTVTLTLSAAPDDGAEVTLGYTAPASNPVRDAAGNPAPGLTSVLVLRGPVVDDIVFGPELMPTDVPADRYGYTEAHLSSNVLGLRRYKAHKMVAHDEGDRLTFEVVFNRPVKVTGTGSDPILKFRLWGETKTATWNRESGTSLSKTLTFTWGPVATGDNDFEGIKVTKLDVSMGKDIVDSDGRKFVAGSFEDEPFKGPRIFGGFHEMRIDAKGYAVEGEMYEFSVKRKVIRSGDLDEEIYVLVGITDSAFPGTPALGRHEGSDNGPGRRAVTFKPGATEGRRSNTEVLPSVTPPDDEGPTEGRTMTIALHATHVTLENEAGELAHRIYMPRRSVDGVFEVATVPVRPIGTARAGAAPAIVGTPAVSAPQRNGAYAAEERIEAQVAFDTVVIVDETGGSPTLAIALAGRRHDAAYVSGSGSATLRFALEAPAGAEGAAAARAIANGLVLNGATVRDAQGTDAVLEFGENPRIASLAIGAAPGGDGTWDAGETVEVAVAFEEPVTVDTEAGTPTLRARVGAATYAIPYASGTGTDTLTFAVTREDGAAPAPTVIVEGDSLALNRGAIESTAGLVADIAHPGAARAGFAAPELPSIEASDAEAREGEALEFRLELSQASETPVSVDYETADGTAQEGADYVPVSGTVSFAPGETVKTIAVATLSDGNAEPAETLPLRLSNAEGATLATTEASGTIAASGGADTFTGAFSGAPEEHDGETEFTLTLTFDEEPEGLSYKTVRDSLFTREGGTIGGARRASPPSNKAFVLMVTPSADEAVTLTLKAVPPCGQEKTVCTAGGSVLSGPLGVTVPGPAALSVADAEVQEGPGAVLEFVVSLDRVRHAPVRVDYATANGEAVAGDDYVHTAGTLTFAPGETGHTVSVPVLADEHDEDSETLTLRLANPVGARIADGEAVGTIRNNGAIPKAWIARFGRTVAEQVLEAVEGRMRATPAPGVAVALAGERIGGQAEPGAEVALAGWLKGETDPEEAQRLTSRAVTPRDLLTGSSFALTAETDGKDLVSLWGRAAVTRFDGREGDLMLDGEVVTGMLGADWTRGRWTAGLIVSHSAGEGGYSGAPGAGDGAGNGPGAGTGPGSGSGASGRVEATLTGVFPWGRYALSDRLEAWGAAGYGQGELTVTPKRPGTDEDGAAIRAGLELGMAAAGLRGVLLDPESGSGFRLTGKIDAMVVQTASGRGRSADGGNLAPARATVTRLRLGLEGSRPILFDGGFTLTPSLEIGVRHDGGDAETGFGLDLGGGLALSDPKRGLQAELRGRGLLTHESKGFRDLGFSGSLAWEGNPGSDRGAKLRLTQTVGGSSSGGAGALLSRTTLEGLAANDDGAGGNDELKSRRLELKFGYGLSAFGDRFTWTPEVGVDLSDTGRDYSLGWRLVRGAGSGGDGGSLDLSFEATRRESANDDTPPVHEVGLRLTARF